MSWDEAEEVGVEILSRVLALHVYAHDEGGKYVKQLIERICRRGDEWARSDNGTYYLTMAKFGKRIEEKENKQ